MANTAPNQGVYRMNVAPTADRFDEYRIPPNVEKCQLHGLAMTIGKFHTEVKTLSDRCECCGFPLDKDEISLTSSRSELSILGIGFPCFFELSVDMNGLLAVVAIVAGLYNFFSNLSAKDCIDYAIATTDRNICVATWTTNWGIANKQYHDGLLTIQSILNLIVVVLLIIAMHWILKRNRELINEFDASNLTPSDFTVKVENLPVNVTEARIRSFFKSGLRNFQEGSIKNVNMGFDIGELVHLQKRLKDYVKMENKVKQLKQQHRPIPSDYPPEADIKKEVENLEKEIKKYDKEMVSSATKFSRVAFVTFNTPKEANEVKENLGLTPGRYFYLKFCPTILDCFWGRKRSDFMIEGHIIEVDRSPEPTDIQWENLAYTQLERLGYQAKSMLGLLVVVAISFGVNLGLSYWQAKSFTTTTDNTSRIVSIIISLFIAGFNAILPIVLNYLTQTEHAHDQTSFTGGVANKLIIAQFINTAIVPLVVNIIQGSYWGPSGLVPSVLWIFIVTTVSTWLLSIFNPFHFYRLIKRRFILNSPETCDLTQQEANRWFEGEPFDIAREYAANINLCLFAIFYATMLPVGLAFVIVTLTINYWVDKYVLLRRSAWPVPINKQLALDMVDILAYVPFVFASGNIICMHILRDDKGKGLEWIALIIAAAVVALPARWVNKFLFRIDSLNEETSPYDEARVLFFTDYALVNPVTSSKAREELIQFLLDKETDETNKRYYQGLRQQQGSGGQGGMMQDIGRYALGAHLSNQRGQVATDPAQAYVMINRQASVYEGARNRMNVSQADNVYNLARPGNFINPAVLINQNSPNLPRRGNSQGQALYPQQQIIQPQQQTYVPYPAYNNNPGYQMVPQPVMPPTGNNSGNYMMVNQIPPQQMMPYQQQGYPQQGYPQQGYPQQGNPPPYNAVPGQQMAPGIAYAPPPPPGQQQPYPNGNQGYPKFN